MLRQQISVLGWTNWAANGPLRARGRDAIGGFEDELPGGDAMVLGVSIVDEDLNVAKPVLKEVGARPRGRCLRDAELVDLRDEDGSDVARSELVFDERDELRDGVEGAAVFERLVLPRASHRVVREEHGGGVAQREEIVARVLCSRFARFAVRSLLVLAQMRELLLDERSRDLFAARVAGEGLDKALPAELNPEREYVAAKHMAVHGREREELLQRDDAGLAVGGAGDEGRLRREEGAGAEELAAERARREAHGGVRDDVDGAHALDGQELNLADGRALGAERGADVGALAVAADDVSALAVEVLVREDGDDAEAREHGRLHEAVAVVLGDREVALVLGRKLGGAHGWADECAGRRGLRNEQCARMACVGGVWTTSRRRFGVSDALELGHVSVQQTCRGVRIHISFIRIQAA